MQYGNVRRGLGIDMCAVALWQTIDMTADLDACRQVVAHMMVGEVGTLPDEEGHAIIRLAAGMSRHSEGAARLIAIWDEIARQRSMLRRLVPRPLRPAARAVWRAMTPQWLRQQLS